MLFFLMSARHPAKQLLFTRALTHPCMCSSLAHCLEVAEVEVRVVAVAGSVGWPVLC
jgi:hypothetical protein